MILKNRVALVTGATGFLGSHLVQRLSHGGVTVRALARLPNRDQIIRDLPNVEMIMGDITEAQRMKEITDGVDYVFHVAAAMGGKLDYQKQVNIDGTTCVTYAAIEANVKRLVHVSSIGYYGFPPPPLVTEDTSITKTSSPYNITKASAEIMLRTIAEAKSLSYSIIRPAMIYGARSHAWTDLMFKLARWKPTPFIGDGSGYAHPIYVDDVIDLMTTLATHPKADGEAFNCAPDPAPTWRDYLGHYSTLVGHQNWLSLPKPLFKTVAPFAEFGATLLGEPRAIPQMIDFITSKSTYSMQKANNLLDWQPSISLEDGIQSCIPYLQEKGLL
jgi:nucleoside-diphosphate-sugar epimerase